MTLRREHIQIAGMAVLGIIALGLLFLIGFAVSHAIDHVTPDGKVPMMDAGLFSTGLVTLQTVVGAIRSVWESQERSALAEGLSNSTPSSVPNPPAGETS